MDDVQKKFRSELQWQRKRSTKRENCSEESSRRPQETNGESFSKERGFICVRDMDCWFEMWIWQKIEKISWTERPSTDDGRGTKIDDGHNPRKTKKLDRSHTQRKFITENSTGGENRRQKNRGKAEDENAWRDYDTRTHQAKSSAQDRARWRHHHRNLSTGRRELEEEGSAIWENASEMLDSSLS